MAKKDRFPPGYSAGFAPPNESEGSGCSGRIDTIEYPSGPTRKWVDLNSASKDGFSVPVQVIPVSKLSKFERKSLVLRLTSELDQVRLLQNKVQSQKIKSVNAPISKAATRDILNFNNNAQQKGIGKQAKKPIGGLGSGPGKKGSGFNRSISGRFKPSSARGNANTVGLLKQCEGLLKKLMTQQYAWVFNKPVDVVELNIPDYFNVIKTPMDLGTIKSKITSGKYSCPLDFLADVRLTFTNAKTYNPPGTDVHIMADAMSQFFELRWKAIEKKLVISTTPSLPEKSGVVDEIEINKPLSPFKKRKLSPRRNEVVMQEPIKRKMTDEEKHKISTELESFIGDLPDSVIDFLRAHTSKGDGEEDEIEIDIDELSDDTLFALRKLLDDHLPEKHKSPTKSEACEIELPNVSGLSNSSLHVDKGNDPMDDDVDIGGNETPVTSCHPILIDKDTGGRAEECNEAGPESDGGSECSKGSSVKQMQDDIGQTAESDKTDAVDDLVGHSSVNEMDQLEQSSQMKLSSSDSNGLLDGESTPNERPVSPDKLYRAALLKNRFADTILKAREKTLTQDDKADPERLRREKEEQKREKARLQAEAKVAEDARRRAEAEAAAEAKKRRELEREAAREALLKMEKTVEINENSRFLQDLEMLSSTVLPEQLLPSSVDEASPEHSQDGFGSFKFGGGSNALEQLGLYMKVDDEDEEAEPPNMPNASNDAEEGEID